MNRSPAGRNVPLLMVPFTLVLLAAVVRRRLTPRAPAVLALSAAVPLLCFASYLIATGDLPGDEFAWVRIDDPAFAEQCRAYFEGELANSVAITPELHKRRAGWLRRAKWTVSHWLVTTMDYNVTRRTNFGLE